ncbi:MAG: hypothetical protein FJY88_00310 [Candidatus Eisenbacteria bacterium]|nr:hypothetical protein [Candidatus Eisenbacteria bacterium]
MRMHRIVPAACLLLIAFIGSAGGVIPLQTSPYWQSTPNGQYGTGLGVSDLNGDGWVDLVVANGNDMARQRLVVYLNQGNGNFPLAPTWSSTDIDYHGHLDLADVDGDGFVDCAVAVYIGPSGFSTPGKVKLYRGNGNGTFSATPIWQSAEDFYCFSVAFGDMDMDGDPDLACAAGEDYENSPERRRIFRNDGGVLGTAPAWLSTEVEYSLDVTWADFNGDGALDLAFAGSSCPNRIYFSQAGAIQTTAGWSSTDASIYANTAAAGDLNGDGWIDLAIADNSQLGGSGRFKLYLNLGNGTLSTVPGWVSNQTGYGSHVSFVDIDEDGDLDLAAGTWWDPVRIYENVAGVLGANPSYTSATDSVIENEVWEDVDNDALQRGLSADFVGDGARRLFYLPSRPARELIRVIVGDSEIDPEDVYLDPDDAWFILDAPPPTYADVRVTYVSSTDLDLAVSNWDSNIGEYLFRNTRNPALVSEGGGTDRFQLVVAPNPSTGPVRLFTQGGVLRLGWSCEIIDLAGRRLWSRAVCDDALAWDGRDAAGRMLPAGVYLLRARFADGRVMQTKLTRAR